MMRKQEPDEPEPERSDMADTLIVLVQWTLGVTLCVAVILASLQWGLG
jgi:hypothetical protein